MKFLQATKIWLLVLQILAISACGERLSPPELDRVLKASWCSYQQTFISPEGRVILPERGGGAISEAQAYALLRAVWAGDEATFIRVYTWTHKNLSREDHLLSWHWGPRPDGSWGVLDANTASDGDLDYALALALAARRGWRPPAGLPAYLAEAREVLAGILSKEVVALPGGLLLLTPGNWHEAAPPYLINPSYFSPAAYRLFSQLLNDRKNVEPPPLALSQQARAPALHHPPSPLRGEGRGGGEWASLQRSTYELLERLSQGMGGSPGVGLFPDWCRMDAKVRFSAAPGRDTNFGWEAARLPWRLALDHLWFGKPQAAQILAARFLPFFKKEWQTKGRLLAVYNFDGAPAVDYESPVLYAGVLAAALTAGDRDFARQMAEKIMAFYHEKDGLAYFIAPNNYYANNWAWLGLALYAGWVRP